jgi:hypothetical protein
MKLKTYSLWAAVAILSTAVIEVSAKEKAEEQQPYAVPGRYIVVLKHGHLPHQVADTHGLKPHHVFSHALQGFSGEVSAERLEALRQDPRVDFVEPELQMFASAQTIPTGVKRIGATLSPMAKIDGLDDRVNVDIAILDTGISAHPDLNVYTNVSFIAGQVTDGNGHGTHVAGIAAALDNGSGVVGVAPGARLWAVKVMDDLGSGTSSSLIQGIDFVTQNAGQIEVANLSLTGIGTSLALRQAISNSVAAGIVFVVSAGNDTRDIYGPDGTFDTPDDAIPAAYPEVLTVSALNDLDGVASADDAIAFFSNYSRSVVAGNPVTSPGLAIDLAAPGVNITSTYLNGGYATMSGTSMAAPHVAGAAALYIAAHGRATTAAGVYAIRQALINLAQPQSSWGSLNTQDPDGNREGLVYVATIGPTVNNAPVVSIASPVSGASVAAGSTITFSGSAIDTEDGNISSKLVWTSSIDGQIGTGSSFARSLSSGTHTITVTATDSGGKTGTGTCTVTVQAVNNAPVVTVSSPLGGSTYAYNATIPFTASAIDVEDGTITANLKWTSSISGAIGSGGSFGTSLVPGTHTIVASVTDSGGKTGSATVIVTVKPDAAPVVAIASPVAGANITSSSTVSFAGTATDAESGNLTAGLVWVSSIDGQIGTGGSFSRTLSPGTHTITALSTDSGGATGSTTTTITVQSTTQPPPPTPTLNVSVVTDKTSYISRSRASITATVDDGVNRVAGAAVHMAVTTASGTVQSADAITDANGVALFGYSVNKRYGLGTYTVVVTASKSGYNSGSGSTGFSVTR